jgi:hypothetical protein
MLRYFPWELKTSFDCCWLFTSENFQPNRGRDICKTACLEIGELFPLNVDLVGCILQPVFSILSCRKHCLVSNRVCGTKNIVVGQMAGMCCLYVSGQWCDHVLRIFMITTLRNHAVTTSSFEILGEGPKSKCASARHFSIIELGRYMNLSSIV